MVKTSKFKMFAASIFMRRIMVVEAFAPKYLHSKLKNLNAVRVLPSSNRVPPTVAIIQSPQTSNVYFTSTAISMSSTETGSINDTSIDMNSDFEKNEETSTTTRDLYDSGFDEDDDEEASEEENYEDDDEEEEEGETSELYNRIRNSVDKAIVSQTRKKDSLQKELDKAKSLEDTMNRANLIISNLYQLPSGTKSAIVCDWEQGGKEIELVLDDEYGSAQEEADALFVSARKMKRGSAVVGSFITETKQALEVLQDALLDLDFAAGEGKNSDGKIDPGRLHLLSDRLERTAKKTGFVMQKKSSSSSSPSKRNARSKRARQSTRPQNTFRKFLSPGGCIVLVGRNRRDNEAICFQVSRQDDIWMHSRGCPGAHVLLQVRRGSPRPTEECMQFAANLAAFYSDARTERKAPITTASPKHIQKPRGAPLGAVKVREELNTLTGYPADVDDELKVAREKSGVIWDESGSRSLGGKAKNRKKTQANAKQIIAKKRAEKKAKRSRRQGADSDNSTPESWY